MSSCCCTATTFGSTGTAFPAETVPNRKSWMIIKRLESLFISTFHNSLYFVEWLSVPVIISPKLLCISNTMEGYGMDGAFMPFCLQKYTNFMKTPSPPSNILTPQTKIWVLLMVVIVVKDFILHLQKKLQIFIMGEMARY